METSIERSGSDFVGAGHVESVGEEGGEGKFDVGLAARYSVANFGAQAVFALLTTGFPLYLNTYPELSAQPELIGLLSNERALVAAVAQPVVGRISDRTRTPLGRRRPFFLIGIPLMSVALMLLATHPPFWVMLGVMTVAAFFLWVALDPYVAMMADLFPPQQRGRVGGILGLAQMLGSILFLLLAIALWKDHEALVFGLTIGILIVAFGFTFLTVKEPPIPLDEEPRPKETVKRRPVDYVKGLLSYREAAKYTLALGFFWLGNGGATPFVTLFAVKALKANESEAFYLPLAYVIMTAICALPVGFLADRIGKKAVMTIGLLVYGV